MMLLIFAVYMWKYIGKDAFVKALAVFIIFSLPVLWAVRIGLPMFS